MYGDEFHAATIKLKSSMAHSMSSKLSRGILTLMPFSTRSLNWNQSVFMLCRKGLLVVGSNRFARVNIIGEWSEERSKHDSAVTE